ncbi:hypothetical protein U9M48_045029 [Paspalum notatum var. saurae]|uniref:CCHC-type domain-containing protein n=1 Tax=Paspalum notatum var. saurae TaxID=547442 RepID=A0AAQ3UW90_PASNO
MVIINVVSTKSTLAADRNFATTLKHKRTKISAESLITSLDVEEKARAKNTKGGENQPMANMVQNKRNHGKDKGKNKLNKTTNFEKKNKAELPCFTCGEFGHFSKDCPERADRQGKRVSNGQSSKTVNTVTASNTGDTEYVFQSSDWWIDTGANVHVCADINVFSSYKVTRDCSVLMENRSAAYVLDIGMVDLKFTSGKIVQLKNVQHVPSMNKNLVSGSFLLRDGFKVVLESNKIVVSRHGLFIGKGYVCGGLFRLSLSDFSNKCVNHICGGINDDASLWRGRLCHLTPELDAPTVVSESPHETILEEDDNEAQRNSKRQRVAKSFGNDFIVYLVDNTPTSISEAYASPDANNWRETVQSELDSILSNGTWELTERPYGCKPVGCKWVFKKKFRPDSTIEKYKARLVVKEHPSVLEGYSDANWISDDELYATSGYVFMLGGAVSWRSCKQTILTRSTIEAELAALDKAYVEADWLRELLMDLPVVEKPIPAILMNCDNQTVIAKVNSDKENAKSSRHVRRRVKSVRKMRHFGMISLTYIQTEKNLADPFTNGLSRNMIDIASREMCLRPT